MAQAYVESNASIENICPSFQYMDDDDSGETQNEKICKYIVATIAKHGGSAGVVNINPEYAVSSSNIPNDSDYIFQAIMLWNPTKLFPDSIQRFKCYQCSSSVHQLPFEKHYSVRTLYGKEQIVLLVSSKYACPKGHTYPGYDPRLLEILPSFELIPFLLFHKSGVTRDLFDYIVSAVSSGSKFNEIERLLLENYWQWHSQHEHAFWNSVKLYTKSNPKYHIADFHFEPFVPSKSKHPSNDMITSCFLVYFMENKKHFTNCMVNEMAEQWISLDHTFKVASNIGINNPDCRWAKQFSSLLCVLNEVGKVLTWKLTKSEAFEHVEDMLQGLKARHEANGIKFKGACIDNCCHWRSKLQTVFGNDFVVVLDLFHAISRISRKIPKRNNLRSECMKDLRLVFRSPTDVGENRTEETPGCDIMKEQMDNFVKQWSTIRNDKGVAVLPKKAIKECNKLLKHIDRGCLSGIPTHISTSRNERLHRELKRQITNCKLGVAVAVAALTIAFYRHNSKTSNGVVPPVLALKNEILSKAENQNARNETTESFGIGPLMELDSVYCAGLSSWNNETCNTSAISASIESSLQDANNESSCFDQVVHSFLSFKSFEEKTSFINSNSIHFQSKFIPFLPTVLAVIQHEELQQAYNCLDDHSTDGQLLHLFGTITDQKHLNLVQALALHITALSSEPQHAQYFDQLGLLTSSKITDIVTGLSTRIGTINEICSQQQLQAVANSMCATFCILTKCSKFPIIPVFPERQFNNSPLFYFFYTETDTFIPLKRVELNKDQSDIVEETASNREIFCTCGRSHRSLNAKCVSTEGKYRSRCKCFLSGLDCNNKCQCNGCENPNGKRPARQCHRINRKRQRFHHRSQEVLNSIDGGLELMIKHQELLTLGKWTKTEHFLFEALLCWFKKSQTTPTPQIITEHFNAICNQLLQLSTVPLSLGIKSELQVDSKMKVHHNFLKQFHSQFKQLIASLYEQSDY